MGGATLSAVVLVSPNFSKARVHLGAHDICEEDWVGTHLVRQRWMIFHPGYNPQTDDNDLVILRLKRDIRFGPKVWMISLPSDEATRDCPVEEYHKGYVRKARKSCDYHEYDEYDDYDENEDDYYHESGDDEYDSESEFNSRDIYNNYFNHQETDEEDEDDIEYDYEYSDNCTTYYDGKWATVAGWGATYKFDGSCILRQAKKKIYPNHHGLCLDDSDYVMDRDKICAYNPKWYSDSCQVGGRHKERAP